MPAAPPQYKMLVFSPLVIASSAMLCAWEHLGDAQAAQEHLPQLSALVDVGAVRRALDPCTPLSTSASRPHTGLTPASTRCRPFPRCPLQLELLQCKTILQDFFKASFPQAAAKAGTHRQAGRESPDSIMAHHTA